MVLMRAVQGSRCLWKGVTTAASRQRRDKIRFRSTKAAAVNGHAASLTTTTVAEKESTNHDKSFLRGETLNLAADLRTFRPGDKLEIPYETTVR